jgi:cytochrome c5
MSDNIHEEHEATTGPIKNPKQLLITVLASFVIPIFIIISLVKFVTSGDKPAAGATDVNAAIAARIHPVGMVEIRDANRPLKTGEEVFKAQCTTCHSAGVAGAPKFGDKTAWAPRIKQGYEALLNSALHGKNAMPPQGGGDFEDVEIGRAVVYMANAGGADFPVPDRPAGTTTANAGDSAAAVVPAPAGMATAPAPVAQEVATSAPPSPPPAPSAMAATPAAAPVAPAAIVASAAATPSAAVNPAGEALYKSVCFACHASGVAGSPKFGDKAAWAPRIATGMPALYNAALHGLNAMPPKGGSSASDADVKAAVDYMVSQSK